MTACVQQIVVRLAEMTGLDALFYGLNRKAKRVVTFHNVLDDEVFTELGGCRDGVTIPASEFRQVVRSLKKRFRFSSDLEDPKTLTISFDDGYCNQAEVAARILKEEGVEGAVLFVSGRALDAREPSAALYPDRLMLWAMKAPETAICDMTGARDWRVATQKLFEMAEADWAHRGETVLDRMDAIYPFRELFSKFSTDYLRQRLTGVTDGQLKDLVASGWKIGWHTESHFPLSKLPESELVRELTPRDDRFKDIMSYPYGSFGHVGEEAVRTAQDLGYRCAYANIVQPRKMHGQYFLPRYVLPTQSAAIDFELCGLKHFLRQRECLPV